MKRWFKYVKPYWLYFVLGPLCMIAEIAGEALMPRFLATVINEASLGIDISVRNMVLMILTRAS